MQSSLGKRHFSYFSFLFERPDKVKHPSFANMTDRVIKDHTLINPKKTYMNNLYWMPQFYQASNLSSQFTDQILKFKNIRKWNQGHYVALTQLVLIEAIRDTTFDYSFSYQADPDDICHFHGTIDCLLYQKYGHELGIPLLPIFMPTQHRQYQNDYYPIAQAVSAGFWCLKHMQMIDPEIQYCRAIHTDGHRWRLYEIHDMFVKKTDWFTPKLNPTVVRRQGIVAARMFDDYEHMLSVIGMIRFALGIRENVVEKGSQIEIQEQEPEKISINRTIQERKVTQVFKQIPFEREHVPHALEDQGEGHTLIGEQKNTKQIK